MSISIAFHDNILDVRGTTKCITNYAYWGRELLGIRPLIMYNKEYESNIDVINKLKTDFDVVGYVDKSQIDDILEEYACDYLFMKKSGFPDGVISKRAINLVNACSGYWQPYWIHGDVYAMGSKWLSSITNDSLPFVPDIINLPVIDKNLRSELGIPSDAFVFGRTGGYETFDIDWVHKVIRKVIKERSDVWFLFQNTKPFMRSKRVIYLGKSFSDEKTAKFINTCDAMIHARIFGESFGVACAEFSFLNKPIITWAKSKEKSHLDILGEKAIKYYDQNDLKRILLEINHDIIGNIKWNKYSDYNPKSVMKKFEEVYLRQ